jgi:predicted nucleic acid-binding protein
MNRAVFDTNILIDFANDRPEAVQLIRGCADRLISVVTWVEFMTGIPLPIVENARLFLEANFEVIYPDEKIAGLTAELRRRRFKFPDAMIYATARAEGAPLVTRNTKDFDAAEPGVHIPYK